MICMSNILYKLFVSMAEYVCPWPFNSSGSSSNQASFSKYSRCWAAVTGPVNTMIKGLRTGATFFS